MSGHARQLLGSMWSLACGIAVDSMGLLMQMEPLSSVEVACLAEELLLHLELRLGLYAQGSGSNTGHVPARPRLKIRLQIELQASEGLTVRCSNVA